MMSLLDDDDVISQSCDNHATDSLVQANESVIASQKRLQSMEKWSVYSCIFQYTCFSLQVCAGTTEN